MRTLVRMAMTPPDDDLPPVEPPARVTGRASVPGPTRSGEGGSISGRARVGAPVSPAGPTGRAARGAKVAKNGKNGKNGSSGPAGAPVYRGAKRRPKWGRIALVTFIALALIGGLGAIAGYFYLKGVDNGSTAPTRSPRSPATARPRPWTARSTSSCWAATRGTRTRPWTRPARPAPTPSC